jgi:hypothetical protein
MSKEKVVKTIQHMGARHYTEQITEPNPDWIYSQYGTYTRYLSFKLHGYFPVCLNIKTSGCPDFKEVNDLVLLYIAINNEFGIINEELELLGIPRMPQTSQAGTAEQQKPNANEVNASKPQQYAFDPAKITAVYNFCIETNVLSNTISNVAFINAVNSANFKTIHDNAEQQRSKSKCKYIIFILSKFVAGNDWYLTTAHSINTEPNRCSGITVPLDWKNRADALK